MTPLSEHRTLSEARAAAINHARQFGESIIHVNELDGEHHDERVRARLQGADTGRRQGAARGAMIWDQGA